MSVSTKATTPTYFYVLLTVATVASVVMSVMRLEPIRALFTGIATVFIAVAALNHARDAVRRSLRV